MSLSNSLERKEAICLLHRMLSRLPTHSSPLLQELPSDGVYFYYEDDEIIRCGDEILERIVRVGTHRKDGGLPRRLIDHYWANKDGSVFRKHIGSALIRKNGKSEDLLRSWNAKGLPYDTSIESEVDSHIREHLKFRTLFVPDISERDYLERNTIALLSAEVPKTSETWLGQYSPHAEVRRSGQWSVKHVGAPLEAAPQPLLARIKELVDLSIRNDAARRSIASTWKWAYINQALRKVKEDRIDNQLRIVSLERLFNETEDGWVALHLARELRVMHKLEAALDYATQAESLLPIPARKAEAREEIELIKSNLRSRTSQEPEVLVVVGCSPEKIWNTEKGAETYVPAMQAYRGDYFRTWLERDLHQPILTQRSWRWIILSGKYGFIEPDHPICDYDVNLLNPSHGPISKESLKAQAHKQSRWTDKLRLSDFKEVVVHASAGYLEVVREIFPDKTVRSWKEFIAE